MIRPDSLALVLIMAGSPLLADDGRVLFDFDQPTANRSWQTVNDTVMGGRSTGQFRITDTQTLEFFGNLSLQNNGGFASVRSRPFQPELKPGDALVVRIRGDGRKYTFNLYVPRRLTAFSYRTSFQTRKNEWIEVTLPLKTFVATSFGRPVPNQRLNPAEVSGIGVLLGDKKAGAFRMEIDWIKVVAQSQVTEP